LKKERSILFWVCAQRNSIPIAQSEHAKLGKQNCETDWFEFFFFLIPDFFWKSVHPVSSAFTANGLQPGVSCDSGGLRSIGKIKIFS